MKKTLLLLCALLGLGVCGAWAETKTFTVTFAQGNAYGTFYQANGDADGGYYWDPKWVSGGNNCNQLPYVTITSDANSLSGYNARCLNGNYTISVPDGLIITGYTMQAKSYEEGVEAGTTVKYITPAGQSAVTLNTSTDTEVAVTGLSSNTATFSITGTAGQSSRVIFSSFTINVQGEIITSLASADSEKAYYIASRRGFMSMVPGYAANTVKSTSYTPQAFKIVNEGGSIYLKTLNGKYITSAGEQADAASGVLASDASNVTDFPFVLKIGSNYLNAGTGGTYGIVWNTWGANGTGEYDQGNCYAIMEAPADEILNYSLTDSNGASYTGTYRGIYGVTVPEFTGCAGYTLTGTAWDSSTRTFSATINFPFPVSSNSQNNYTYIANYYNDNFIWFVTGNTDTKVYANKEDHTAYHTTYTQFDWSVEPTFTSATSSFTFKIKNRATGTYLYSTSNTNSHSNAVTLSETGTELTYIKGGSYYRWVLPTGKQLSINSSGDNKGNQELGTWGQHDGTAIKIVERTDFETLINNFSAAAAAFEPYNALIGEGLNQYWGENATDMQSAYNEAIDPSSTFTAAALEANTTLLENPSSKLNINLPATGKFYRIKGYSNNYITFNKVNSNAAMNGTKSVNNIIYYNESKNLIFFGGGYGLYRTHTAAPVGSTLNAYTFSQGAQLSHYYVMSNAKEYYSGDGEYCYDNTASGTKLDRNGSPVTSGSYQTDWTLEEVSSLPVTITAAGYATLNAPVALTIPGDVQAYYVSSLTSTEATLTEITTTIPANTPVILKADVAETYNFAITTGGTDVSASNKLSGTIAATAFEADQIYTLQRNKADTQTGLFPKAAGTLAGFKAYLPADALSSITLVKGFVFNFQDADGICTVVKDPFTTENGAIYNLAGQRINKLQKGVNIVNGKKVLVK